MTFTDNTYESCIEAETSIKAGAHEKFQTGAVATIATGHVVHDTYTAFLPPLLPIFIANLSLTKIEAGLLTVFTQAPSLVQPVIGHVSDRLIRHHFVFLAPAVTAFFMSLLGLMPNYLMLAILLTLVGFSSAAFHAIAPVIAGKLSGRNLGRGMGFWMVGGEMGRVLGPVVIVTAIRIFTVNGVPWLMILGLSASLFLFLRLRNVHTQTTGDPRSLPWRFALKRMKPVIIPLIGMILLRSFMIAALTIYLPVFLTERGSGLWLAGASLSLLEAAGVVGAMLGGALSDYLGRRFILVICVVVSSLFMFVLLMTHGWIHFPVLLILGLTLLSTTPVIMALVQENFPENRALANGIYMALSFVIRSGGILLLGLMGDFWGLQFAYMASGLFMMLSLPFIFMLPASELRQKKGFFFINE